MNGEIVSGCSKQPTLKLTAVDGDTSEMGLLRKIANGEVVITQVLDILPGRTIRQARGITIVFGQKEVS